MLFERAKSGVKTRLANALRRYFHRLLISLWRPNDLLKGGIALPRMRWPPIDDISPWPVRPKSISSGTPTDTIVHQSTVGRERFLFASSKEVAEEVLQKVDKKIPQALLSYIHNLDWCIIQHVV